MSITRSQSPVRLGLIGASQIAGKVIPSIRSVRDISIHGVAAMRPGKAKEFSEKYEIPRYYNSYLDCLSDPEINAVYISTLSSNHAEAIRMSLEAGKHVLCEKPLVTSLEQAESLFKLARERRLILLEGLMYRFHPQVQKLVEIVRSGRIGDVVSVRINFSFILYDFVEATRRKRATSAAGGGALLDLGCYCADFIQMALGCSDETPEILSASRRQIDDPDFDLSSSAILSFPSGKKAIFECAVDTPSLNNWEASGTKGSVSALRFDPQGTSEVPLYLVNEDSEAQLITCPSTDTFAAQFDHFAKAVLGKTNPHIRPEESIWTARTLEMIRKKSVVS